MYHFQTVKQMARYALLLAFGLVPASLNAGPLNIANNPLEIANNVEPNVMVLNDDSGSMDWSILSPGTTEGKYIISCPGCPYLDYAYIQADPENIFFYTVPSETTMNNINAFNGNFFVVNNYNEDQWRGVWRTLNHNYNTVYYNPDVQYKPWPGVDDSGTLFGNANPAAARVDPYVSTSATFNLTTNNTFVTGIPIPFSPFFFNFNETAYPARYYTWTDTDGDTDVDFDDAHQLVEIRTSGACSTGAICPTTFTRRGTREDCGGSKDEPDVLVTCSVAQELQNYANFYSYYRRRELTAKGAITTALDPVTNIRVGMATINNNTNNRIQVASMNSEASTGNKLALFDAIYKTQSSSGTPLRRNLAALGEYFACNSGNIFGTGSSSPGNANCPVLASPAGECQQNFTILMTDGFWNGNDPAVGNADGDENNSGTPQGPFDGGSYADNFNNTLADVAMHYYERDLHSSLQDEVPLTTRDTNQYIGTAEPFEKMHQHMTTYTVGFGVKGALNAFPDDAKTAPATFGGNASGWPDPEATTTGKIDDLRHAAWNSRGDFLSAADQTELTNSLDAIFKDIQDGTGSASAIAFNTQDLQSGSRVFRAFFDTTRNSGKVVAQSITLTGEILPAELWNASDLLADRINSTNPPSTDNRIIITYDDNNFTGIPFKWSDLNPGQQAKLKSPTIINNPPTPDDLGKNRVNYLRGHADNEGTNFNSGEFRPRTNTTTGKREILGDVVHSTPFFVGAPAAANRDQAPFPTSTGDLYSEFVSAYSNRTEVVYVGANDGMLHGFNANDGSEIMAYVPNSILSSITELTDPDYTHNYFVDMTPAVQHAFFAPTSGTNANISSWNTVLIGGLGAGGPGYFALNVTNPANLTTEAGAADEVMWEFTQSDDVGTGPTNNNLNLGIHIREPIIGMSNVDGANGEKRWVAIFGNGYNSASADGDAELYVLFLDGGLDGIWTRGTDFIKINTGNGKAESADGSTPNGLGAIRPIDINADGTIDVVYAGDLQGNVYRFNLSSTTVSGLTNSANNPVQTLFQARYNASNGPIQPITNRPIVVKNPNETGFIVLIGTGSYFTVDDATNTDIQSIYGLWDDFTNPSDNIVPVSYNRLQEQTLTNSGTVSGTTVRTLSNNTFTFGTNGQRKQGWVIDLDVTSGGVIEFPGEKAVRNFLLRGDFVFVNTVLPKDKISCKVGPGSFTLGFNPVTGGSGSVPVFDINNDGVFDADDNVGGVDGANNVVSGRRNDKTTLSDSSTIGDFLVSSGADKSIDKVRINIGDSSATGRHSWREIIRE